MPFYHGTKAGFKGPNGYVFPGDNHGRDNWKLSRSNVVYVTLDLDLAWYYAEAATGRGKSKVLEVTPMSTLYIDDSTVEGEEQESYYCDYARVDRVIRVEE